MTRAAWDVERVLPTAEEREERAELRDKAIGCACCGHWSPYVCCKHVNCIKCVECDEAARASAEEYEAAR